MSDYVVEMIGEHGNCVEQIEVSLDFDPSCDSIRAKEFIRDIIWNRGASFHPIEGEEGYAGWYRFVINISPPSLMEEEE
jgi:hypothetical protein